MKKWLYFLLAVLLIIPMLFIFSSCTALIESNMLDEDSLAMALIYNANKEMRKTDSYTAETTLLLKTSPSVAKLRQDTAFYYSESKNGGPIVRLENKSYSVSYNNIKTLLYEGSEYYLDGKTYIYNHMEHGEAKLCGETPDNYVDYYFNPKGNIIGIEFLELADSVSCAMQSSGSYLLNLSGFSTTDLEYIMLYLGLLELSCYNERMVEDLTIEVYFTDDYKIYATNYVFSYQDNHSLEFNTAYYNYNSTDATVEFKSIDYKEVENIEQIKEVSAKMSEAMLGLCEDVNIKTSVVVTDDYNDVIYSGRGEGKLKVQDSLDGLSYDFDWSQGDTTFYVKYSDSVYSTNISGTKETAEIYDLLARYELYTYMSMFLTFNSSSVKSMKTDGDTIDFTMIYTSELNDYICDVLGIISLPSGSNKIKVTYSDGEISEVNCVFDSYAIYSGVRLGVELTINVEFD